MTDARNMRKLMEALEERLVHTSTDDKTGEYKGKHADNPNIDYSTEEKGGEIHKVIAHLQADPSGRYTKLGRNLLRMERIKARMDALKEEVKEESRELIADLFHADDACRTREVDTVSFLFMMTKDPKETVSPKYKDILDVLTNHMTPELIAMKERLLKEMVTKTQKAPAIRVAKDKAEEGLEEGLGDTWKSIKAACRKILSGVLAWGKDYDARLDGLKAQVAMGESSLEEKSANILDHGRGDADIKWGSLLTRGIDKLTKKPERTAADQADQRARNKDYRNALRGESLEEGNPLTEEPGEDPRLTGQPIMYRGWEIGYDSEAALWTGEGYYCHVEGWEPGDPDGEDGTRSTVGYYTFGSVQDCKDQIDDDLDGEPLVKEDGDWYDQDDFQTYNDNEADDYRNEGDDEFEGAMEVEDAIMFAAELLGTKIDLNSELGMLMRREIGQYAHMVTVSQNEDGSVDFDCADPGSVNLNYNPLLTARLENGHVTWDHA